MMKKKSKARGGLSGTEEAALAARQAGLLDAYTESASSNAISDSDKFKEGYTKKKGKKEKNRKSESEEPPPPPPVEEPAEEPAESWEDEPVESWEDIEAPEQPVPAKVKQEMRKQEKLRKKEEEKKRAGGALQEEEKGDTVQKVTETLDKVSIADNAKPDKPIATVDDVKADREAKKAAKAAAKASAKNKKATEPAKSDAKMETTETKPAQQDVTKDDKAAEADKKDGKKKEEGKGKELTEEQKQKAEEKAKRKAEFEAKKLAELKEKGGEGETAGGGKSKAEQKAERRAKQEAQRAAKAQQADEKTKAATAPAKIRVPVEIQADQKKAEKKLAKSLASQNIPARTKAQRLVPLFSHLHQYEKDNAATKDLPVVGGPVHPAVLEAGLQTTEGEKLSGEERCSLVLGALQRVVEDTLYTIKDLASCDLFKELDNALKPNLTFLKQCRPLSIAISNAIRTIKPKLKALDRSQSMETLAEDVKTTFDDFIQENINLASTQISITGGRKIQNGDVILTYSDSVLVERLLVEAAREKTFRVIVTDGRVHCRGRLLAERLCREGIDTTYILLTALTQVLPVVTKVFVGCEGVMANGCVMAEVGTSQIALLADSVGIPVLVCCQSFKFTERVQTDSFVNNELLDPEELTNTGGQSEFLGNWRDHPSLHLLNLVYDITPASLVSALITELSVLPTTSVPVILRLKHTDGQLGS